MYKTVATTTCENLTASTSECITEYVLPFAYQDWLQVNLWIIFLLAFIVAGFFFSNTLKN